ncbi:MAG: DUF5703 domain-containing protein [Sphingobacteriales bacterium]
MKNPCRYLANIILPLLLLYTDVKAQKDISAYDVIWTSQSENSYGSMPIGNGDIGANVWVTKDGILHILLSKTDAQSEIGRLLKIGRVDIQLQPNLLVSETFKQQLYVYDGMLVIEATDKNNTIRINCWVDANQPVVHIQGSSSNAIDIQATHILWRKTSRLLTGNERHSAYGVGFRPEPFSSEVDTTLKSNLGIAWCHHNKSSIWKMTLDNQQIEDFGQQSSDPLLNQTFGALVSGKNFSAINDTILFTQTATKRFDLEIVILKKKTKSESEWLTTVENKTREIKNSNTKKTIEQHKKWWHQFWDRHYIIIQSEKEKEKTFQLTQAYMLQRYINACAGRGSLPIKFNGSIFNVEVNEKTGSAEKGYDADFRLWGGHYWFQNTRLIYWTMYHSGDTEFMKAFFNMYIHALPLATFRTKKYFDHEGAYFPETLTSWGTYLPDNYGWDRIGKKNGVSDNLYIRYYWQSGLELNTMMMEYFLYTKDTSYFKNSMIPFIKNIITFYDKHYPRDQDNKLKIEPAQALETFQDGIHTPAPEVAGLLQNLQEIIKLDTIFQDDLFLQQCRRLLLEIPPLPLKDSLGTKILLPGLRLGERANIENPELYAIFPYRIFDVNQPDLSIAVNTFEKRFYKQTGGWHQDAIQAALLGKTKEAKEMVEFNFTHKHQSSRFPAFWGPNYDWIPDQDHGTVAMRALQNMLVQSRADTTHLLPAWPEDWNVAFKIHIPGNTILEGNYEKGKGVKLREKPKNISIKMAY